MGRELRRLIPLGVSCLAVDALVTSTLVKIGHTPAQFAGPTFAAFALLILPLQLALTTLLHLALLIMHDHDVAVPASLPTLLGLSAATGAAIFWWASPIIGAVAGLVTITGWLVSIRDRLE